MKFSINQFISNPAHEYVSIIRNQNQLKVEHSHDYYEFFLVYHGSAVHRINGCRQYLMQGSLVFIRPDDLHFYSGISEDFEIINLLISSVTIQALFGYLGENFDPEPFLSSELPPMVKLPEKLFSQLVNELEQLVLSKRILKQKSDIFFRITLMKIFTDCFPMYPKETYSNIPEWLRWLALEMMKKENFSEGLQAMKRLSGKSEEHLSRSCKKFFNRTPTEFINELRVEYTVSEIMNTSEKIIDICSDAGFNSLSHYYHIFKKMYGVSPVMLRKGHKPEGIHGLVIAPPANRHDFPQGLNFQPSVSG